MNGPTRSSAPIVLVHGAWHGSWAWSLVTPLLAAAGRRSIAVDIEAHGLAAKLPASALTRPFDPGAYATEPSPLADVTLASAAEGLVRQLEAIGEPVVLVGHSLLGHVVGAAAERAPALVERLVYVCAVMAGSGADAGGYAQSPENEGEQVGALVVADPGVVGAVRLDVRSADEGYRAALREALYGDVPRDIADGAIRLLSSDLPLGIPGGAIELTAAGWGSIPRSYIRCSADLAVRPALQTRFIAEADAAFAATATRVVDLDSSHSPFLSMPDRVASAILEA
jgi:pimeloyl-ACP methyl ester carboxylesterase